MNLLILAVVLTADLDADARAALALAQSQAFTVRPAADPIRDAMRESVRTGQPLFCWVRYKCASTQNQMDGLHVHTEADWWGVTQGVVVCSPAGGWVYKRAVVTPEDVCASNLRRAAVREAGVTSRAALGQRPALVRGRQVCVG